MSSPPDSNPTIIKAGDDSFYLATTSSVYFNVVDVKAELAALDARKESLLALLASAKSAGVSVD